jgi:hypothetical protein
MTLKSGRELKTCGEFLVTESAEEHGARLICSTTACHHPYALASSGRLIGCLASVVAQAKRKAGAGVIGYNGSGK